MSSRSLGSLTVDLIARTFGFEQGMDKAARTADKRMKEIEARAKKFGVVIGAALAAGATAAANELRNAVNRMDDLSKAAQRVSLPTEQFSALVYAGKLADVEIGTLQTSLGRLTKAQADSFKTTSEQGRVFKALGIEVSDASGKMRSSYDVLLDFADAFKRQEGSPEIVAAGLKIFGRSFQELIPLIKDGSEGLRSAAEEAEALGQVISTEAGQAAEAFNDNLSRLGMVVSGLANAVAAELLPDLRALTDEWVRSAKEGDRLTSTAKEIADAIRGVVNWMREGSQVGASFRETLAQVSVMAAAAKENLSGIFSLDQSRIDQSRADFVEAGKKAWDAAIHGVEQGKAARPMLPIIESSDLRAADERRAAQMRTAAAEAERLRRLAFGDAPKAGGRSGRSGGKSDEQREAERLESSYKSLIAQMEQRIDLFGKEGEAARIRYDVEKGALSGLTEAQKANAIALGERLDTMARMKELQDAANEAVRRETEAFERQREVVTDMIADMEFELALIGMGNAEREKAIALRYAGAAATDEERQRIEQLIDAQREAIRVAEGWDHVQRGLSDTLFDVATGAKSLKDAVVDFFDTLAKNIARMIADQWAEKLTDMFKAQAGNSASSGGGFNWGSLIGALFGGGKASGGSVGPGKIHPVNESGMEMLSVRGRDYLLTGNSSGNITPAHQVTAGGRGIVQNFYNPVMADRQTDAQRQREAATRMQRQVARA